MFYVYEHWRSDKEEPFYVGKGSGNRAYDMYRRNYIHREVQSTLVKCSMGIEVRIAFVTDSEDIAYLIEIETIRLWRERGVLLQANIHKGGSGHSGWKHSEHSRRMMSATRAGHPCLKIRGENHPFYGKKFGVQLLTKEQRAATRHVLTAQDRIKQVAAMRHNPPVLGKRWKLSGQSLENNRAGRAKSWVTRRANLGMS